MPSQQSLQISQQIKQAQLFPRLVSQCQALCTAGEHTDPLSTKLVSLITSVTALEAAECASLTYQASSSHLQARVFALLVQVLISRYRRQRTALSHQSDASHLRLRGRPALGFGHHLLSLRRLHFQVGVGGGHLCEITVYRF